MLIFLLKIICFCNFFVDSASLGPYSRPSGYIAHSIGADRSPGLPPRGTIFYFFKKIRTTIKSCSIYTNCIQNCTFCQYFCLFVFFVKCINSAPLREPSSIHSWRAGSYFATRTCIFEKIQKSKIYEVNTYKPNKIYLLIHTISCNYLVRVFYVL